MKDYSQGKVYALRSYETDLIYIGSTTQTLSRRLANHKDDYRRYLNGLNQSKITSFELLGFEDVFIELIEHYSCNTKDELERREGEIIRSAENCVNKMKFLGLEKTIRAKTYRMENKEIISQKNKIYYEENKELIANKAKLYRESNKEIVSNIQKNYREKNKEKIKQYREENKETIAQKEKVYREENKEFISTRKQKYYQDNKEKITQIKKEYYEKTRHLQAELICCIGCRAEITKRCLTRHLKTKKHLEAVNETQ